MADYKFDGKNFKDRRGSKIGYVDGKNIRERNGSKVGYIDGKNIRNKSGSKLAVFDGNTVRDSRGAKIGTKNDVNKFIDGAGGMTLVALWLFFVR